MGATLQNENGVGVLRVTGTLRKSEFDAIQAAGLRALAASPTKEGRLLVLAEGFEGWQKGDDWGDMTFFVEHGDQIAKIAVVGDPRHEAEWLAFLGAGLRRAPVKCFPPDQLAQAREWLA